VTSKRRIAVSLVVTALAAALLIAEPAAAAYTKTKAPMRACTRLADATGSCYAWRTLPAGIGVSLRCWKKESWYAGTNLWFWLRGNGSQGFVSANQIGSQYSTPWCGNDPYIRAVTWAGRNLLEDVYGDNGGECLLFVQTAWSRAGLNIGTGGTAYNYWRTNPRHYPRVRYDMSPPVGALVFWKPTSGHPEGHVAISMGSGNAISSYERKWHYVHTMSIASRTIKWRYPYAGYLVPR
jgi:hypothetical protein